MAEVTVLNTELLKKINNDAVKHDRNRSVTDGFIEQLDPNGVHLVSFSMLHNDVEIRARILAKTKFSMEPTEIWLDMPIDVFNMLDRVEVPDSGSS